MIVCSFCDVISDQLEVWVCLKRKEEEAELLGL